MNEMPSLESGDFSTTFGGKEGFKEDGNDSGTFEERKKAKSRYN